MFHKYIGSLFWALRNFKRLNGKYISFTDEGWCVGLEPIVLSENLTTKEGEDE